MKHILSQIFLLTTLCVSAQIITLDPAFPERDQLVTITYDAALGSAGLVGESQVYMHTGLITENSSNGSDWKFVIGDWGTDDARVKMTNVGNNKHELQIIINNFYGVPANTVIEQLAMVFRNVDGSKEGKTATGGDIYLDLPDEQDGFVVRFESPTEENTFAEIGQTVPIKIVSSNDSTKIELFVQGVKVLTEEDTNVLEYDFSVTEIGEYGISFRATSSEGLFFDNINIIASPITIVNPLPQDAVPGITRLDDNSIRCVLIAPGKSNGYVIGTFNDWTPSEPYFMSITPDGNYLWADIQGIPASEDHALLYVLDGTITTADPFSELVFDTWNDSGISEAAFPNIPDFDFPNNGYVTWLRPDDEFVWQHPQPEIDNEDLVIYELLVRDFVDNRSYAEILDTLDYLAGLGINAIEFMPINEFEGNESWGYNPSFHMALDKYYGTPEKFKELVDACHEKGIAIILDVVYNHAFSQSPFAQMWWDQGAFRPTEDNPFLNVEARHPFNVGYDFDHESQFTKQFVKRVTQYWIEEYKIDGFRFDLSKGFTQVDAMGNVGSWGNYDASRIAILKDYADHIWSVDSDNKIILEHFADNTEERELAAYGMMVWSNLGHTINDATMGFNDNSNFDWLDYKRRDWEAPLAVGYMESHDEERLMYKNINFGRQNSNYSTRDIPTALQRVEMASAFFYAFPGPKMLWQFGEQGYDYSINWCTDGSVNQNCRLTPKPIRWDYLADLDRKRLVDVTSAIIKLKTEYDIASEVDYEYNLNGDVKLYRLEKDGLNGLIIGNFGINPTSKVPVFPAVGTYFDYLSGDTLLVTTLFQSLDLAAGEYHIYLDQNIGDQIIVSGVEDPTAQIQEYRLYPNPASELTTLAITLEQSTDLALSIYNSQGQLVKQSDTSAGAGKSLISIDLGELPTGVYHLQISGGQFTLTDRILVE